MLVPAAEDTTPFHEASLRDENIFYNGMPVQWDEDHVCTYFIPNEIATSKYRHLIENATITEWNEYEYMEDVEEWKDDPDEYKYRLELIPWRKKHHSFFFSWAWAQEKESGSYSKSIDVIEWAGLDKEDLIDQEPYPA